MTRGVRSVLAVATGIIGAGPVHGQQKLEIDYDAGRVIIDDDWRSIRWESAIDHERGILFLHDGEEPEGIMAFSLETGEWVRTYSAPAGDGPQEIPGGIDGVSVASNGRLYLSGGTRVIEFGPEGEYLSNWTPNTLPRGNGAVCDFDGQPAVPAPGGVIRRGTAVADETIGPGVMVGAELEEYDEAALVTSSLQWHARIACTEDALFVLYTFDDASTPRLDGPDSVFVFYRSNRKGVLPMPPEFAAEQVETAGPLMETDGRGNLVLLGIPAIWTSGEHTRQGIVVDIQTGCHATIHNPEPNEFQYELRGIYRDSAVVATLYHEEGVENGQRSVHYYDYADMVGLYPLRRVSGVPCPGMLPSVNPDP